MANIDTNQNYAKVVTRAWTDGAYLAQLLNNPMPALMEAGIDVPDDMTMKVLENTDRELHLILQSQTVGLLSDEALDHLAGGNDFFDVGGGIDDAIPNEW